MQNIKTVLMTRDGMTSQEADEYIASVVEELREKLENNEYCLDMCMDSFGLEDDYIFELIEML
jgi:hypothetical protein